MEKENILNIYRVGKEKRGFYTTDLHYFNYSQTGYKKEDAKRYSINLSDSKVFYPIEELNLNPFTWGKIEGKAETFEKLGINCDYYEDNELYAYTSTDDLVDYGIKKGYDIIYFSQIPSNNGLGPKFDELFINNINLIKENLKEQLLLELKRSQILSKSKQGDQYKTRPGENRYTRRTKSKVAATVADYNRIDMNALFKGDILEFGIKIQGETNNYVVTILFEHILDEFKRQIRQNNNKLEFKCILQGLIKVFNSEDVYVACTCEDFIYGGYNFYGVKQNYNADPKFGKAMEAPMIRNPNDTKGAGCKHILLCLANLDWLIKIASVIHNYIWYCKEHMEYNYTRYIAPKLFDNVQGMLFDPDHPELPPDQETELTTDKDIINRANIQGRTRGQFKPGNPYRFQKKEPQTNNNALGLKFGNEKEKQLIPSNNEENERPQ